MMVIKTDKEQAHHRLVLPDSVTLFSFVFLISCSRTLSDVKGVSAGGPGLGTGDIGHRCSTLETSSATAVFGGASSGGGLQEQTSTSTQSGPRLLKSLDVLKFSVASIHKVSFL